MRVDIGDGVRLFFDVVGSSLRPTDEEMIDKPVLLLLHGGPGSDHSGFRPFFDRFADTHQVVYLDHRGNGRSDQRSDPSGWDLDTWADDVVRFCDALEIERPVVLGNSFGGFVTMRYGSRHPGHASKLVLSSTAARPHEEESARRFEELGGPRARELFESIFVRGEPFDPDYATVNMPLYNRRAISIGPRRIWRNLRVQEHFNQAFSDGFDLRSDLANITDPTLVLAGADDPMTPVGASEEIFALLPDGVGRLEVFDDCGHGSYIDQPDATEKVLREFLAD
ncbi:MAG: alpha/beta hydrolase [Acidimicrobiales bacterium]|nr:alpha/beta hydrolase [Acidimicrobiales bacterium]